MTSFSGTKGLLGGKKEDSSPVFLSSEDNDLCLQDTPEFWWPLTIIEELFLVCFPALFQMLPSLVYAFLIYFEKGNSRTLILVSLDLTVWTKAGALPQLPRGCSKDVRGFQKTTLVNVERPEIVPKSSGMLKNIPSSLRTLFATSWLISLPM